MDTWSNTTEGVQLENVTKFYGHPTAKWYHTPQKTGNNWNKSPNHPQRWKPWTHQHHHTATKKNTIAHSGTTGRKLQENIKHPKTKGGNHHRTTTNQISIKHSGTKGGKLENLLEDVYTPYSTRVFLARLTKVRHDTCDKARLLSQVWGVEPNTSSGYELAEPTHHLHLIVRMQDCIST